MSKLLNSIKKNIEREITKGLESGKERFLVNFLPEEILDLLYRQVDGFFEGKIHYLMIVEEPPYEHYDGGEITKSLRIVEGAVNKARTKLAGSESLLIFSGPRKNLQGSIDTTFLKIARQTDNIIRDMVAYVDNGNHIDFLEDLFHKIIDKSNPRLGKDRDDLVWEMLQRVEKLIEENSGMVRLEAMLANLGVISGTFRDNYTESIELLTFVGEEVAKVGFTKFIKDISGKNNQDFLTENQHVANALVDFTDYIEANGNVLNFSQNPWQHYQNNTEGWWEVLNIDIWQELLQNKDYQKTSTFKIIPIEYLAKGGNNEYLFEGEAHLRLDPPYIKAEWSTTKRGKIQEGVSSEIVVGQTQLSGNLPYTTIKADSGERHRTLKAFSLMGNEAPFYFRFRSAKKVENRKISNGKASLSAVLNGQGYHNIELYVGQGWSCNKIEGKDISSSDDGIMVLETPPPKLLKLPENKKYEIRIFTDEECEYVFYFQNKDGHKFEYEIEFSSEDESITRVESHFQYLIQRHLETKTASLPEIDLPSSKLLDLEAKIFNSPDFCYPLIISMDFPDQVLTGEKDEGVLTNYVFDLNQDPRPNVEKFNSSLSDLIKIRSEIILAILRDLPKGTSIVNLEGVDFTKFSEDTQNSVTDYLKAFVAALESPETKEMVMWFETASLLENLDDRHLDYSPLAIFLTPLHPITLAWQLHAQNILEESLHDECPVAGLLNPSNIPSVWHLMDNYGNQSNYMSISTNFDYWRVFVDSRRIQQLALAVENPLNILFSELGMSYDIMERGMKSNQIERALGQLHNMYPAKGTKSISIMGKNDFSGEVNQGILEWLEKNYGQSRGNDDILFWKNYEPYGMEVYDGRENSKSPDPSMFTYLIEEQKVQLRWMKSGEEKHTDLGIISQLNMPNRSPRNEPMLYSNLPGGGLWRIDGQINVEGSGIIKSLVSSFPKGYKERGLNGYIQKATSQVESDFAQLGKSNSIFYNPDSDMISRALEQSELCALSSSMIDISYLVSGGGRTLWEFDLPSYGGRRAGSDGYYLISKSNEFYISMFNERIKAFDNSLDKVDDGVLAEHYERLISNGNITLKRFIQGGAGSTGEIGVLITQLLLQARAQNKSFKGLFPVESTYINFLIPADPFQERIESLKRALGIKNMNRPDYFMASIKKEEIILGALEVKCRTGAMSDIDMKNILEEQAEDGVQFLKALQGHQKTRLWRMAFPSLIYEMILFSYNLYLANGYLGKDKMPIIQNIIDALFNNTANVKFNHGGKLIAIVNRNLSGMVTPNILAIAKSHTHFLVNNDYEGFFRDSFVDVEYQNFIDLDFKDQKVNIIPARNTELSDNKSLKTDKGSKDSSKSRREVLPTATPLTKDKTTAMESDNLSKVHNSKKYKLPKDDLEYKYKSILSTLDEHGVLVKRAGVDEYIEGPAFVQFRIKPERGVKINKIESIHDELKLNLKLSREQAIKFDVDKGYVVLTVPKAESERYYVSAKELWKDWQPKEDSLEVVIGEGLLGDKIKLDFSSSKTPHLLIGGQTGSGKSEALNTILFGLKEFYGPEKVRFIMVDPKGTELLPFEGSEYLLGQIGMDDEDAIEYLSLAVKEMQRRYKLMKGESVRSLSEYNKKVGLDNGFPHWVIVLDEYGDLTHSKEAKKVIEESLIRIAQKGRASGIHAIVTTQNPTANVVSSNIRSNLAAQLALKVRGKTESNIILTRSGAETLNGKGDALLNSGSGMTRLQVALYTLPSG